MVIGAKMVFKVWLARVAFATDIAPELAHSVRWSNILALQCVS
jgi:hypothetical protein